MNRVFLIGRLTNDPELRENEKYKQCKFTVAVNRIKEGADFITCIAWGKTAELIDKYFSKGYQIALEGHIQTGSYEKDGKKVYTSDVIVENLTFISNNPINAEGKEKDIVKEEEKSDPFKEFGEEVDIDSVLPF